MGMTDSTITRERYDELFDLYRQIGAERDQLHRDWSNARDEIDALRDRIAALEAQIAAQGWRPMTEPPKEDGYYLVTGENHAEVWYWEAPHTEVDDWEAGGRVWNLGNIWDSHEGNGDYKDISANGDDNWATHYKKIQWPSREEIMAVLDLRYDAEDKPPTD